MASSAPPVTDDRQLEKLAAEPEEPLFLTLRHAEAMAPLVIVLAFLPTLYAVAYRTLTEAGARQGMVALQCLAADNLGEFVDPAAGAFPAPIAFQPQLMNWLTALALWLFGVGQAVGHVASAYLCTAGLVIATYLLARRLGGDRLGLFSALLMAFNPHVLQMAQEPIPQSAAALFAVLAMTGTVAHWQKSPGVASIQLLLGGISLGLCLLAGGPVAIDAVLVLLLYAAWWKLDGWQRGPREQPFDRSRVSRGRSLRAVLILSATGFAVGGWRSLIMGSRYGGDYWLTWLGSRSASVGSLVAPTSSAGWLTLVVQWNHLVLPLSVLALAGALVIVRELLTRKEDPGRQHRGLLLVWLLVSTVWWTLHEIHGDSAAGVTDFWTITLIIPLTMSAAVGLLAIVDRDLPFPWVIAIALVAGLDLAWLGFRGIAAGNSLPADSSSGGLLLSCLGIAVAVALVVAFARPAASAESRRRAVLAGIVLGLVATNCAWGAVAVRRSDSSDRELDELRLALSRLPPVKRWTLVVPQQTASIPVQPPAQLVYTLRSVWPKAEMTRIYSWEALEARLAAVETSESRRSHLVILWSSNGRVRSTIPAGLLRAAAPPYVYREHEVSAYTPGPVSH
jgi:4-amino-4-deoxy-L-arabinose transferase-like glycosyltransferase